MRGDGSQSPRWWLHATLVVGLALCVLGFVVELRRGIDGHLPAWVYVLEWPLFAVCGVVIWWRLLRGEHQQDVPPPAASDAAAVTDDPELAAWQAYVTRFEAAQREVGQQGSGPNDSGHERDDD